MTEESLSPILMLFLNVFILFFCYFFACREERSGQYFSIRVVCMKQALASEWNIINTPI